MPLTFLFVLSILTALQHPTRDDASRSTTALVRVSHNPATRHAGVRIRHYRRETTSAASQRAERTIVPVAPRTWLRR